jgi:ABC-2 type transport system ATP-binding protein
LIGPALRVITGHALGTEIPLDTQVVLGRASAPPMDLAQDPEVSRQHARVVRSGDALVLEDLGSTNGTYLNGWRIPAPQLLNPGDRIQLGGTVIELGAAVSATRRRPVLLAEAYREEQRPDRSSSALYVDGIQKSYGDLHVLKGVDLEVQPGEIVGLLGHNGAGKTSLVSIVAGLRTADTGRVYIEGVDAFAHPREARQSLGIAPQDLGIYPSMTVRENLTYFGQLSGLGGSLLRDRVQEIAEALSLTPKFDSRAGSMSGGQKRRLHTGMAMLHRPRLLILDEPTVGADVRTRQEILDFVKKLAAEGHAVCYSTHYMPEVEELGASVAILQGGRIIARGSIAQLIAEHSSPALELQFDGPAPDLDLYGDVTREDSVLRIKSNHPAQVAADAFARLGVHGARLLNVEVIRPSLESVYLALTETRYSGTHETPENAPLPTPALPGAYAGRP